ncbi:MAG: HEPN domain-containing protein [Nitrospirae bacterium]|nr:HEPN domain-containing protein [Nitrospirota bacterium]
MKEQLSLEDRIGLSKYRSEIANQRLKEARLLLKEELYNGAISRAYFAIHAISRSLLILHDIKASTHEGVKIMLSKELIKEAKILPQDFAKKYSQLKALREDADYEDFMEYTKEDAEDAIVIAEKFIQKGLEVIEGIITKSKI